MFRSSLRGAAPSASVAHWAGSRFATSRPRVGPDPFSVLPRYALAGLNIGCRRQIIGHPEASIKIRSRI